VGPAKIETLIATKVIGDMNVIHATNAE